MKNRMMIALMLLMAPLAAKPCGNFIDQIFIDEIDVTFNKITIGPDGRIYTTFVSGDEPYQFAGVAVSDRCASRQGLFQFGGESGGDEPGDFRNPQGIAVSPEGNIYVVDRGNNRIQVFDRCGNFLSLFPQLIKTIKAPVDELLPIGIALGNDKIYVTYRGDDSDDPVDGRGVQVFDRCGTFLYAFGENILDYPEGIAVSPEGNIYVTDRDMDIKEYSLGDGNVKIFDRCGNFLATMGNDVLEDPTDIAFTSDGYIVVTDNGIPKTANDFVRVFNRCGQFLYQFNEPPTAPAEINNPTGIAVSQENLIYVVDSSVTSNITVFQ